MKLTDLTKEQKSTYVGVLTEVQKDQLLGQLYESDSYFNPIQDINDNWVISVEEMEQCINLDFLWVKELELILYEPKPNPSPFE